MQRPIAVFLLAFASGVYSRVCVLLLMEASTVAGVGRDVQDAAFGVHGSRVIHHLEVSIGDESYLFRAQL